MTKALIIIDMVNDLVSGVLENKEYSGKIIEPIQKLIKHARDNPKEWVIVYSNDAHHEDDVEVVKVFGKHAIEGTEGAQVIEELKPTGAENEIISPKRFYGAFDLTGLGEILEQRGVNEVVLVGQHTHCCVRHTAYGAFMRNYTIKVPSDGVCVFPGVDNAAALDYLKTIYAAIITTTDEILTTRSL